MTPLVDPPPYDVRSGLHVAQAARDAGAVVDAPELPLHDVSVTFSFLGTLDDARTFTGELANALQEIDTELRAGVVAFAIVTRMPA